MLTQTPMFIVRMFAPGWACVFMSFHKSRAAAEQRAQYWRKRWAARPGERTFDVLEA